MPDDPISPSDDIAQKAQGWRLEANLFRQQAQARIDQAEALEARAGVWEDAASQLIQLAADKAAQSVVQPPKPPEGLP